jgi:hypothetical protein
VLQQRDDLADRPGHREAVLPQLLVDRLAIQPLEREEIQRGRVQFKQRQEQIATKLLQSFRCMRWLGLPRHKRPAGPHERDVLGAHAQVGQGAAAARVGAARRGAAGDVRWLDAAAARAQ